MYKFIHNGCWLLVLVTIALIGGLTSFYRMPPLHMFNIESPQQLKAFFHYTKDRIPFVSAHRGGAREGYPENCLATFENTLRHTWSVIEVDPHYTKDSAIVLMHDPTLDRTSTGHGKVSDYTLQELKELKLKDTEGNVTEYHIATLDEALEWAKGKTVLVLDQKDVSIEARVKKIKEHQAEAHAIVMAYNFEDAQRCYALDKNIMMEVFIPDREAAIKFEQTGIPWENVVAFVTHQQPKDKTVCQYIHERRAMCIIGSSRTNDKTYLEGKINENELERGYYEILQAGADIIEADLGIEAGKTLQGMPNNEESSKKKFFTR